MFILASASEGRRGLLKKEGFKFKTMVTNTKEETFADPKETVIWNSVKKAITAYCSEKEKTKDPIVACDTIVFFEGHIIGKPRNREDAEKILRMLSGKWHKVYSGIAVFNGRKLKVGCSYSEVKLRKMGEEEIRKECKKKIVLRRAGAYAIQEKNNPIEKFKGRFDVIVGIDTKMLKRLLGEIK